MTKIATWNVNSVKARLEHLVRYLGEAKPDVMLLQELKCVDEAFPADEIEDQGYNIAVVGQKTYNGVAILSKSPIDVELRRLPGDEGDEQARYIEVFTGGLTVASIYLPNGNPAESEKYPYKLSFMERLHDRAAELLALGDDFVLGGDFNVIPDDRDVHDPERFADDALYLPATRAAWRKIVHLGLTDAYRALHPEEGRYSWWDYRGGGYARDQGLRIDHFLLSPGAADRLEACDIDRRPRGWERPSDHTPVWCEIGG